MRNEPTEQDTDVFFSPSDGVTDSSSLLGPCSFDIPGSTSFDIGYLSQEPLDEWKEIRKEQHRDYEESLEADRKKRCIYR